MLQIKLAKNILDFNTIADLATDIWREHYIKIIGVAQVEYMLEKFQTAAAIENQVKEGYQYYQVNFENVPVGYFSFIKKEDTLFLSKIYVLKNYRGKGVGKFMLQFILQKAKEFNSDSITLTVNKNNIDSIVAYEKMGFKNMGALVADIGNGFFMDDNKMVKTLV